MTNVYQHPAGQARYREASAWVTKLDRGLSADEENELKQWFAEHHDNHALFLDVAEQWDQLDELSRLADLFDEPATHRRNQSRLHWVAAAATVVLAIAVGFFALSGSQPAGVKSIQVASTAEKIYETAIGEQSTVVLDDGSRVVLNTNSRLSVEYSMFHRKLILNRGEIHVDVAPDTSRPLTVFAGGKMIQAVGTSFGVEIRDERQVELVVTEGRVLVALRPPTAASASSSQAPVLPTTSLTVSQGEEVRLSEQSTTDSTVTVVSEEEINVKLAWRNGDLVFRGEPLGAALADFSRYTTVEFVFLNDALKAERIIGRFKTGDVEGLLDGLSKNLSIAYERTDDGKVYLSSL